MATERNVEHHSSLTHRIKGFFRRIYRVVSSHFGLIFVLIVYSFVGAALFWAIEGRHEKEEKADILSLRDSIIHNLWNQSHLLANEKNFSVTVREELKRYEEQLHTAFLHGVNSDSEDTVWDFWGSLFFCATVYTTIGYGHIAPATDVGRIVTIIYALIGIPLCLVVLADLGKLFTRAIKFLWSFIRRFYYTGQCRKVRQAKPVQLIQEKLEQLDPRSKDSDEQEDEDVTDTGYVVDDDFNLPPAVAIGITVAYILLGAMMYTQWEDWSYLEAFYFVFVSISTIGFGDVLPDHPKRFLASFVYLLVGLSLVAMVINVIMEVVSSTIDVAKQKAIELGKKTIGVNLDPDADKEEELETEKKQS